MLTCSRGQPPAGQGKVVPAHGAGAGGRRGNVLARAPVGAHRRANNVLSPPPPRLQQAALASGARAAAGGRRQARHVARDHARGGRPYPCARAGPLARACCGASAHDGGESMDVCIIAQGAARGRWTASHAPQAHRLPLTGSRKRREHGSCWLVCQRRPYSISRVAPPRVPASTVISRDCRRP
jgi:hypothetical protein